MTTIPIDTTKATRIAFGTTEAPDRMRWSELSVFYLDQATPEGKRWLALSVGRTRLEGERTLQDHLLTYSLEACLNLFDNSSLGRSVKAEARDWDEHNRPGMVEVGNPAPREQFAGTDDRAALEWLFGQDPNRTAVAAKLGLGESTLRMALKNGTPLKVPLLSIIPYVDRAQFQADLGGEAAHG